MGQWRTRTRRRTRTIWLRLRCAAMYRAVLNPWDARRFRRSADLEIRTCLRFACEMSGLSTPFHKYGHVCDEGFLAQTRRERRAYPSGVCKEGATTSGPKRTVARRVASLFGSGFVAPRSQPHFGGCSLVAPRQKRKSTQQTWSYL